MNLAIIPARSGSTRIRDKNIAPLCGKPMFGWPLAAAKGSGLFGTIHMSTDSERYASIARDLGFPVDFLRDDCVSANDVGIIEVLRWVVKEYEKRGQTFETICLVYATAALIEAEDLRKGYEVFMGHGREVPVLSVTTYDAPVRRALAVNGEGILEPAFPESWERHSQQLETVYHDAGGFFFIDARRLLADTVKVYRKMAPCVIPRNHAVDIDEPEDMVMAEQLRLGKLAKEQR
ncbi:MAG: pseudaminic acid cytidylyltransferase [Pseudomonadota bacterium]|nr:pseudaminic acid cytidylyltransferase [Pseudomonadota bacterium]